MFVDNATILSQAPPGKLAAAEAALSRIEEGTPLGIGSGSTVDVLVALIERQPGLVEGAVAASSNTEKRLKASGIEVLDLNLTGPLDLYIDGADEVDPGLNLIKGGGAALTREKIIAAACRHFVCIADDSKRVERLGDFPLPLEVIPMARSYVAREIVQMGADPEYREGVITDNGNIILDCHEFKIDDPKALETRLNAIAGLVTCGLFAARGADELIIGRPSGDAETLVPS
jgi:ribose 5-phosphate isomerase A